MTEVEQRQPIKFMSRDHVAAMNEILATSTAARTAGAALDRDYVLGYRLTDGPGGDVVHWTFRLGPGGLALSLDPADRPDVLITGDYGDAIRASQAAREGRQLQTSFETDGDVTVLERIAPAFAVARSAATLDVEFPDSQ